MLFQKNTTTTNVDNIMKFLQTGVYKVLKALQSSFLFNLSLVRLQTGPYIQVWVLGFKKDEDNWRESKRRQSK